MLYVQTLHPQWAKYVADGKLDVIYAHGKDLSSQATESRIVIVDDSSKSLVSSICIALDKKLHKVHKSKVISCLDEDQDFDLIEHMRDIKGGSIWQPVKVERDLRQSYISLHGLLRAINAPVSDSERVKDTKTLTRDKLGNVLVDNLLEWMKSEDSVPADGTWPKFAVALQDPTSTRSRWTQVLKTYTAALCALEKGVDFDDKIRRFNIAISGTSGESDFRGVLHAGVDNYIRPILVHFDETYCKECREKCRDTRREKCQEKLCKALRIPMMPHVFKALSQEQKTYIEERPPRPAELKRFLEFDRPDWYKRLAKRVKTNKWTYQTQMLETHCVASSFVRETFKGKDISSLLSFVNPSCQKTKRQLEVMHRVLVRAGLEIPTRSDLRCSTSSTFRCWLVWSGHVPCRVRHHIDKNPNVQLLYMRPDLIKFRQLVQQDVMIFVMPPFAVKFDLEKVHFSTFVSDHPHLRHKLCCRVPSVEVAKLLDAEFERVTGFELNLAHIHTGEIVEIDLNVKVVFVFPTRLRKVGKLLYEHLCSLTGCRVMCSPTRQYTGQYKSLFPNAIFFVALGDEIDSCSKVLPYPHKWPRYRADIERLVKHEALLVGYEGLRLNLDRVFSALRHPMTMGKRVTVCAPWKCPEELETAITATLGSCVFLVAKTRRQLEKIARNIWCGHRSYRLELNISMWAQPLPPEIARCACLRLDDGRLASVYRSWVTRRSEMLTLHKTESRVLFVFGSGVRTHPMRLDLYTHLLLDADYDCLCIESLAESMDLIVLVGVCNYNLVNSIYVPTLSQGSSKILGALKDYGGELSKFKSDLSAAGLKADIRVPCVLAPGCPHGTDLVFDPIMEVEGAAEWRGAARSVAHLARLTGFPWDIVTENAICDNIPHYPNLGLCFVWFHLHLNNGKPTHCFVDAMNNMAQFILDYHLSSKLNDKVVFPFFAPVNIEEHEGIISRYLEIERNSHPRLIRLIRSWRPMQMTLNAYWVHLPALVNTIQDMFAEDCLLMPQADAISRLERLMYSCRHSPTPLAARSRTRGRLATVARNSES